MPTDLSASERAEVALILGAEWYKVVAFLQFEQPPHKSFDILIYSHPRTLTQMRASMVEMPDYTTMEGWIITSGLESIGVPFLLLDGRLLDLVPFLPMALEGHPSTMKNIQDRLIGS